MHRYPGRSFESTSSEPMTSERANAYGRVMKTLADLSASKLHGDEQQVIRDAADSLFFCEDLGADAEARAALDRVEQLAERLMASDRLSSETVGRLVADVESCGPVQPAMAG
jgi:hypothetical protein